MLASPHHLATARRQRPRRFALGLFIYLVLTIATFALVYRYAVRIAALYGYDIQQKWLQFSLYFLIYVIFAIGLGAALRKAVLAYRRAVRPMDPPPLEAVLRATFLATMTLNTVVALYQARFGAMVGANYFLVGGLGSFAGVLALSRSWFGLVEVISQPPVEVLADVEAGHQGLALANSSWDILRRWLDFLIAGGLIVVSLPMSVPLAILSWLSDPGPLLVAKVAVKRGGKSFRQLKLRTMVKAAERDIGPVPAAPRDIRVTSLGSLLRRTHIDELPQMINIARGDMSLVGPRPERTVFVQRHLAAIPGYARRHRVRPGLAGLAQVYGDYYSTPREKLAYDLLYVRRRSPALDAWLLFTAVLMALFGVSPKRHSRRRSACAVTEVDRWQRAYEALRGGHAPPISASTDGRHPVPPAAEDRVNLAAESPVPPPERERAAGAAQEPAQPVDRPPEGTCDEPVGADPQTHL